MTNKDLEFVISLRKNLSFSRYFYSFFMILAFLNAYHPFASKIDPVYSVCAGIFLFFISINNYLGETRLHKCTAIIEQLINGDPELIKRINDLKNTKTGDSIKGA